MACQDVKEKIIRDRRRNLPVLCEPAIPSDIWESTDCAELETFSHLREMASRWKGEEMIVASLALDLKTLEPCRLCPQCGFVFRKLRKECKFVGMDLAPRKPSCGSLN